MQRAQIKADQKNFYKGYTLVEMAIVLVIVAILIGGIFKGKDFIENAKLKTVVNDFEHITQAYYSYIQRTSHAPGLERGTDGHIISNAIISTDFFQDLVAEGFMLSKQGTAVVTNAYGGVWSVNSSTARGLELCSGNFPAFIVRGIDAKLDDGEANTGRVVTRDSTNTTLIGDYAIAMASDAVFTVCQQLSSS